MRTRKIRKIGNSFYVKLEQVDVRDWGMSPGDEVNVEPTSSSHSEHSSGQPQPSQ